jgi:hypothetical protein
MCLADATLERQNLVGEDGGLFWGADHVCQNRDELFDWSYNSRSNERTGLVHGEG